MAGIIFDAGKTEKALRELDCTPVSGKEFRGKTGEYQMWKTKWGHEFMAPTHSCGHWVIQEIIDTEIHGTNPMKKN